MAEKKVSIIDDVEFGSSNQVFSASIAELKKIGQAKVSHHPEITKEDLQKLYLSFDLNTPKGLQDKCMLDIMFFLVRRGRENLREQTKNSCNRYRCTKLVYVSTITKFFVSIFD